jgi:hypothetical protein
MRLMSLRLSAIISSLSAPNIGSDASNIPALPGTFAAGFC